MTSPLLNYSNLESFEIEQLPIEARQAWTLDGWWMIQYRESREMTIQHL